MAVVVLNPGAPKAPVPRGPPILGWLFPNKDACPAPRAMETRGKKKRHRRSIILKLYTEIQRTKHSQDNLAEKKLKDLYYQTVRLIIKVIRTVWLVLAQG